MNNARSLFWNQVRVLLDAQLKVRYRKTVGGFIWVLMNPLIQFGSQAVIFQWVLNLNMQNYPQFLMCGILPWLYGALTLEMNTSIFVQQSQFLKSYPTDPRVFVVATCLENAINSLATFTLLFTGFVIFGTISGHLLWAFPLAMLPLMLGIGSLSLLFAILNTFLRDTRFMVNFALSVGYFLTPIFYPADRLPAGLQSLLWLNPFYAWIRPFRAHLNGLDLNTFGMDWFAALAVSLGIGFIAQIVWARTSNHVRLHA